MQPSNVLPSAPSDFPNKKVLLLGRAGAGKTSMRSIIFANYLARDTKKLTPTDNIEHSHLRFLGNLVLSLWDCGGQDTFMENYFESQRQHIFRHAQVLIYVLEARTLPLTDNSSDVSLKELAKDLSYMKIAIDSLQQYSTGGSNAPLTFILIHKIDTIHTSLREHVLRKYIYEIKQIAKDAQVYGTSIWDETLFKAWSAIVYSLIPNVHELGKRLRQFAIGCDADEVVLFEKSTFLVIAHATIKEHTDLHRFEKISNICKQFKLTCGKSQANFSSLVIQNPSFTTFIERFTQNTCIIVVVSAKDINPAATMSNIDYGREYFEKIAESMGLGPSL